MARFDAVGWISQRWLRQQARARYDAVANDLQAVDWSLYRHEDAYSNRVLSYNLWGDSTLKLREASLGQGGRHI